jgi:predicted TPR repeat methyltransferase
VFPYIGDLDNLFCLIKTHLVSGGLFGFSTEALTEKNKSSGYVLRAKRRYAHTDQYLRKLARANNMKVETFDQVDLRKDGIQVIAGYIVILSKLPD